MELKHIFAILKSITTFLLIVPYGIETIIGIVICCIIGLLIVPYGIETI